MHIRVRPINAVVVLAFLTGCNPHSDAEDAVRLLMKDPEATQFRNLSKCTSDQSVTLGDYNSKNSYGAYVGFEPFYYAPDTGAVFLSDTEFSLMLDRCFGADDQRSSEKEEPAKSPPLASSTPKHSPTGTPTSEISENEVDVPISSCFGDYCPCDRSDPDYGGADVPLCRNLENGVSVDDDMFAAGAAARDARRQLREFDNDNGEF